MNGVQSDHSASILWISPAYGHCSSNHYVLYRICRWFCPLHALILVSTTPRILIYRTCLYIFHGHDTCPSKFLLCRYRRSLAKIFLIRACNHSKILLSRTNLKRTEEIPCREVYLIESIPHIGSRYGNELHRYLTGSRLLSLRYKPKYIHSKRLSRTNRWTDHLWTLLCR